MQVRIGSVLKCIGPVLTLFLPRITVRVCAMLSGAVLNTLSPGVTGITCCACSRGVVGTILRLIASLNMIVLPTVAGTFTGGGRSRVGSVVRGSFGLIFVLKYPVLFNLSTYTGGLTV